MMVSRFLCVLTSGLLLLLATDGATDDSAAACSSETTACQSDETCVSCVSVISSSSSEVSECAAAIGLDEVTTMTATCADYMDVVCCHDEVSEEACLDNAAFEEYWLCFLEEIYGCMDNELTCSGASPRIGEAWTIVAFVGLTMTLLPLLLWV